MLSLIELGLFGQSRRPVEAKIFGRQLAGSLRLKRALKLGLVASKREWLEEDHHSFFFWLGLVPGIGSRTRIAKQVSS